jgi:predicted lipid-binding transport protein (Tim44 family)
MMSSFFLLLLFWFAEFVLLLIFCFGFSNPCLDPNTDLSLQNKKNDDVIDLKPNAIDEDVADYVEENSEQFKTLTNMKSIEEGWMVSHFVSGAKLAYEEILMAFENGDLEKIKTMTSNEVYLTFKDVIDDRNEKGLKVEASFGGVRDIRIRDVKLNKKNLEANITMIFRCDISYSIRDKNDKIVEGGPDNVKKQKDVWTFARKMNSDIPNWYLIKTE